jgi:vacuolar-type H+-ATPase subunit F/Vma7
MSKIVVVGDEDFSLGFEIVGIEAFPLSKFEELINKKEEIGIIVIKRDDYEKFSIKVKTKVNRLLKPIVVIISEDDIKGNTLREQIIKALGVDLMK